MTDVVATVAAPGATSRRRLITFFGIFALLVAMIPGSVLLRRAAHGPRVLPVEKGVAPAFNLPTLDGNTLSLDSLRGRPVLVNFWASWCVPCRQEFDVLNQAEKDHAIDNLAVVGVLFSDLPGDARKFVAEHHGTWPSLLDDGGHVARAYGVDELPQSFFIRPDGTIMSHVFGGLTNHTIDHQLRLALSR